MPKPPHVSVLIVDDHPLVRLMLRNIIEKQLGWFVCGESFSVNEAVKVFRQHRPQLTIVDLSLVGASGLELIRQIRQIDSRARILVLSMHDENVYAERALRAGAAGYVEKQSDVELIQAAMEAVVKGEFFVSQNINRKLLAGLLHKNNPDAEEPHSQLTNRELEVFNLIGHGVSTREIADRLNLSVKTIESYRENIKFKLGISTSAELVKRAVLWVVEQG